MCVHACSDDEGDQVEETLPLSWDADEDVPIEDWDKLFEHSIYSDFDGFYVFVTWFCWINVV